MISRSRSRRRCKQSEALRSLSRSGRKHYKVYWTKLNGDNGSFQLPLTIGEFKAKLPSLAANSTYKVINGSIALKDSYYLAGADYHLSIIIVKQGAEPSNKAISDTCLHWVPIEHSARYRPPPDHRQELCNAGGQTYKLVSIEKEWYFSLGSCCAFLMLVMVLLMWLAFVHCVVSYDLRRVWDRRWQCPLLCIGVCWKQLVAEPNIVPIKIPICECAERRCSFQISIKRSSNRNGVVQPSALCFTLGYVPWSYWSTISPLWPSTLQCNSIDIWWMACVVVLVREFLK